ncbi:MAG: hypothetical protein ACOYXT_16395 [Bacteroidota bacterium]
MKDFQVWLYVLIAIGYALSRFLKKSGDQPKPEQREPQSGQQPAYGKPTASAKPKALTFEELLREISESKRPEKPVYQPTPPKQEFVDYDDDLGEEERDLEEVDYESKRQDKVYEIYEEAKKKAFERASLEETMNVRDTDMKYGKFNVFEQGQQRNLLEEYTRDFRDPEGFKKALVMSEILNRKF